MNIILADTYMPMCDAWDEIAEDFDNVTVHRGSILDVECDAVVSPANSFGFMDGGVDAAYTGFFGLGVQEELRLRIGRTNIGELLVGEAMLVPTEHAKIRWVIAAPTMRIPEALPSNTVNPFLAARAALLVASREITINTVAMPGLGTLTGHVSPANCARQVRAAIRMTDENWFAETWGDVKLHYKEIIWGA